MWLTLRKALQALASIFKIMRYNILLLVLILSATSCSKLDDYKESPFWEGGPNTLITIQSIEQVSANDNELGSLRVRFNIDEEQLQVPDNIVGFRMDIKDASFTQNIGYNELPRTDSADYVFAFNIERSREYCIAIRAVSLVGSLSRFSEVECIYVK